MAIDHLLVHAERGQMPGERDQHQAHLVWVFEWKALPVPDFALSF
jgi:hypothetical protein